MHVTVTLYSSPGPGGPGAPGRYTCLVKVVFRVIDVPDTPDDITTNWHSVQQRPLAITIISCIKTVSKHLPTRLVLELPPQARLLL